MHVSLWFSKHLHAGVSGVLKAYPGYGSQGSWVDKVCVLACGTKLPLNHLHDRFDTLGQVNDMHFESVMSNE